MCPTWDEWSYPKLLLLWGPSVRSIAVPCRNNPESLDVWTCLGVNPLDMPRTPYWASEEKHPHVIDLYIIHLIIGLHYFL